MMSILSRITLFCLFVAVLSCQSPADSSSGEAETAATEVAATENTATSLANTLTDAERADGWELLFNGKDLNGWHTYGQDTVGKAWKVNEEGSLYLDVAEKDGWQVKGGGDIVTDKAYANYELELEWKIADCGNSGIIYNIIEDDRSDYMWQTGPEMQILDDSCHADAEYPTHRAGTLYDMLTVAEEAVKPAGEWNQVRLKVTDGEVGHYLNEILVANYPNTGEAWEAMVAKSKFKDMENFGKTTSGKIGLQDHGDGVWFRNVKIREVKR